MSPQATDTLRLRSRGAIYNNRYGAVCRSVDYAHSYENGGTLAPARFLCLTGNNGLNYFRLALPTANHQEPVYRQYYVAYGACRWYFDSVVLSCFPVLFVI